MGAEIFTIDNLRRRRERLAAEARDQRRREEASERFRRLLDGPDDTPREAA